MKAVGVSNLGNDNLGGNMGVGPKAKGAFWAVSGNEGEGSCPFWNPTWLTHLYPESPLSTPGFSHKAFW